MLFNYTPSELENKESYKERNLYYKIFAGYLFNGLVPGIEKRKHDFVSKIFKELESADRYKGDLGEIKTALNSVSNGDNKMTFDFHPAQIKSANVSDDAGEMSDILILNDSYLLSVECKFLQAMNYSKDVVQVQNRMDKVSKYLGLKPLQILLMTRSNWQYGSINYDIQRNESKIPLVVVLWEDILEIIEDEGVKKYLAVQLDRNKLPAPKTKESLFGNKLFG